MNIPDRIVQSKRREGWDALGAAGYYQAIATVSPVESAASMAESIRLEPHRNNRGSLSDAARPRGLTSTVPLMSSVLSRGMPPKAAACSVLTDTLFRRRPDLARRAKPCGRAFRLPPRKDLAVCREQILEARSAGASSVLLIASVSDSTRACRLCAICSPDRA